MKSADPIRHAHDAVHARRAAVTVADSRFALPDFPNLPTFTVNLEGALKTHERHN